jgi:uncharacterized membrane protein YhaH (DUF805 family)
VGLLSFLFGFNGRINRAQYWLGTIGVNVVNWVVMLVMAGASALPAGQNPAAALAAAGSQLAMMLPLSVGVAWIAMALQVKRFHDRGQSGWWSVLPIVPMLFMFADFFTAMVEKWPVERLASALGLPFMALLVICLGFFINLGCLAGNDSENKYGPPPGSGGASPAFKPSPSVAPHAASSAKESSLVGAQSAIDRAVAERAQTVAKPRPTPPPAPVAVRPLSAAPSSFGRKPAR